MSVLFPLTNHPSYFFTDSAPSEIYTLSLHDAFRSRRLRVREARLSGPQAAPPDHHRHAHRAAPARRDRKSTRLNSSHTVISYAVFCLKKKENEKFELKRFARQQQRGCDY